MFWIPDHSGIQVSHDANALTRKGSFLRSEPGTQISQSIDRLKIEGWLTEMHTRRKVVKAPH
jgi:hypothetical protein